MSKFEVSIEKIAKIYPHPNADKLELAQVESMSFQFCIGKDSFKVGDEVVYFPIDSVLPQTLVEYLGIGNFLSGKDKNRIKTVKLRGQISQGYVEKLVKILQYLPENAVSDPDHVYEDFTTQLGVTKYDSPEIACSAGNLVPHPDGISTYDIEGCERYGQVFDHLKTVPVYITEKVEGQNYYTAIMPDNNIIVGQRNYQIVPIETATHDLWQLTYDYELIDKLYDIKVKLNASQVTIRGEACGPNIQGNIYELTEKTLFVFDILVDGKYLNVLDFYGICIDFKLPMVPMIASNIYLSQFLSGRTIQEASSGTSFLNSKVLREGIVIKPMIEENNDLLGGRLMLKQRDPVYLSKQKD